MNEISPRPWRIETKHINDHGTIVERKNVVDANGSEIETEIGEWDEGKWTHIIKCVNEHDSIVAERDNLESEKEYWIEMWEQEKELSKGQKEVLIQRAEKAEAEVAELKRIGTGTVRETICKLSRRCEALEKENERLKEFEFMYNGLNK
jgi:hypothetical protein